LLPQWSDWIDVTIATLDYPEDFPPTWHRGVESQMPWLDINDGLPRVRTEDSPSMAEAWNSVASSNSGQVEGSDPDGTIQGTGEIEDQ
jgi:hypothetical protein